MNQIPAGPDGKPDPRRDVTEGKPVPYGQAPKANWRTWAKATLWVVVAVIAVLFIARNSQQVTVDFVFTQREVPLYVALILSLILGALLGAGTVLMWRRNRRKARREERGD